MTIPAWLVPLAAFVLIGGFIAFAFRQGLRVKPDRNPDNWPPDATGGSWPPDGGHPGT
jgi:hypothetical protein